MLDTERQALDAELSYAQAYLGELDSVIQVYKALGGGWSQSSKYRDHAKQPVRQHRNQGGKKRRSEQTDSTTDSFAAKIGLKNRRGGRNVRLPAV